MENCQSFLRNTICDMFHTQIEKKFIEIGEFACRMALKAPERLTVYRVKIFVHREKVNIFYCQ